MDRLGLIVKREFTARVRNKSFVLMTFLSPLIMVGLIFLIVWLSNLNKDVSRTIAVLDESAQLSEPLRDTENTTFLPLEDMTLEEARDFSREGELFGLLHIPAFNALDALPEIRFYSDESPSISTIMYMEKRMGEHITNLKLIRDGVDVPKIEAARTSVDIKMEDFSGEETSKTSTWVQMAFGGALGYLLMMFIIIYGNMVLRSVIEEKTNRIVEIIISSIKPYQLMLGKITGTSLAGVVQFMIWVMLGAVIFAVAGPLLGLQAEMTSPPELEQVEAGNTVVREVFAALVNLPLATLVVSFVFYFIGGYFLYSSVYAAIGAAVDNETDSQQFIFPIIIPLMIAMYVGFFTVLENPHGTISVVFSHIPLTSPVVMLMRIPFGVPWWEIVLSIITLFATFAGTVWLAAKIYRVGILMYGKKPSYKELYKWLKY